MRWPAVKSGGLGVVAMTYVAVDYLRILSPTWHERLQPVLWTLLALVAVTRIPFYRHWSAEFRAAISFLASMIFMLSALLFEACTVRFVTVVLGLNWHNGRPPLPDTGQWLLLALNEKLPEAVVEILRAHIIGLHHYLMLFIMLAFSVLFESVKAPGLGLGARYMFTMAVGRLLRAITFASTILPSARPWCASSRYSIPGHPHRWAQKYYVPYASDANAIRQVIEWDIAYVDTVNYTADYRPDWGSMSFLIDFLRPNTSEGSSWYSLLKKAGGGCNDLVYSGHMFVAVLTAMAWMEAYGGFSSVLIWLLVMHSAQREVRERHHYSVDCVVAIYVGILLWKMTGFIWSAKGGTGDSRLTKLGKIQGRLLQAAKDSDMDEVRELLKDVELGYCFLFLDLLLSSTLEDFLKFPSFFGFRISSMDRAQLLLVGLPLFLFATDLLSLFTPPPPKPPSHHHHHHHHHPHLPKPPLNPETLDISLQKPSASGGIGYGSTVNINFCASCSYRGTAVTMKKMLEAQFPGIDVILDNYPPSLPKRLLSKVVPVFQFGVIGIMMAGEQIFPMIGITTPPPWYYSLRANRFGSIATAWLLGNVMQSFLQSSGAFEVYCNDELVFSKLKEGRFPGEIELKDIIAKTLANSRVTGNLGVVFS